MIYSARGRCCERNSVCQAVMLVEIYFCALFASEVKPRELVKVRCGKL